MPDSPLMVDILTIIVADGRIAVDMVVRIGVGIVVIVDGGGASPIVVPPGSCTSS